MKKLYFEPEFTIQKSFTNDVILTSIGAGDSIGENETPLIPFDPFI